MTLVLLIDDDPLIADIVTVSLGEAGYTVGCLTDGQRAVEVIELKRPALVLLDCAMPLVPGIEVLRRIRSSQTCCSVPVLMLTARGSLTDRDIALRVGATDYMTKPFDLDELAATVDAMINFSWPSRRQSLVQSQARPR
jgi:DNA-binding response OmpR family regulator